MTWSENKSFWVINSSQILSIPWFDATVTVDRRWNSKNVCARCGPTLSLGEREERVVAIFDVVAAVLHLGDVLFEPPPPSAAGDGSGSESSDAVGALSWRARPRRLRN